MTPYREAQQLPGRQCGCAGDGATWADVSACPVHTTETSPKSQEVERAWQEGLAYGRGWADGQRSLKQGGEAA